MNDNKVLKILIVDDEKTNILALADILKPKYEILVARNGQSALDIARESRPDLILLDILMPDMSGFDVLTELKGNDITREIPVIFITGLNSAKDEETGFTLGAVDYITKPFHNAIVKARIKMHLQMVEYIRKIERLGVIDVLTDLPNRRAFDEKINSEWKRAIREKSPISILVIDVDKFKAYNDTYGHPQGDVLLQSLAGIFKDVLKRPADFVARWGGEEFVVLLPNTDLSGGMEIARQIRINVENSTIYTGEGERTSATVSIGVNAKVPNTTDSIQDFILAADKALYIAKKSGRNTVCS